MQIPKSVSRREFIRLSGLAAGAAGLAISTMGRAADPPRGGRDADMVLTQLLEGNKRFMKGDLAHPRRKPEDFVPLAEGQAPLTVIVCCADSRVAPELIFDQGVGDLFVVRVAGNVISGAGASVKGSIEYAVAELSVRLIIVLGHSQCGAVKAAIKHIDDKDALPGSIGNLVDLIRPAVAMVKDKQGDILENAIKANVEQGVQRLKHLEPILADSVKKERLKVVGAVYDLHSGKVTAFG
ncbi:MAG: carbonic anhydrase [Nitrospira sp.]|nr:carbonic anhydrase [Nitrospira sp.]